MDKKHQRMFDEQKWYAEKIINEYYGTPNYNGKSVLNIGCAEGGSLQYFAEKGASCYGIEYSTSRYETAVLNNKSENITFINGDIIKSDTYDDSIDTKLDYIILRDVIEHLHEKSKGLKNIYNLLTRDTGRLFISFPPKYSPYAGHQQGLKGLGKSPYIYLLPNPLYKSFMCITNQNTKSIDTMLDTKKLRISIYGIEKLFRQIGFRVLQKDLFFIRPCYQKRFGWQPKRNQLAQIPLFDELLTLGAIFILTK
ncbi:MAG: class I SAM-dependent methyltransferase [Candidatus Marinimicrobia bacterium]|nr:class I SAM-dependent methyltransferase [Candidatus Neomarinimicrobiota bacterium]